MSDRLAIELDLGRERGDTRRTLARARTSKRGLSQAYAVHVGFEPTDATWKFWRAFRSLDRAADAIFAGENKTARQALFSRS